MESTIQTVPEVDERRTGPPASQFAIPDPLGQFLSRYWGVELAIGLLWVVVAVVVLKFDDASVVTVGVLTGLLLLLFAAEQFVLAAVAPVARWVWAIFGVLLTAAGIVALIDPVNTFAGFADVLGFVFLGIGVLWMVQAFTERLFNPYWWLTLIASVLMLVLAFWVSGQFFLSARGDASGVRRRLGADEGHHGHRPRLPDSEPRLERPAGWRQQAELARTVDRFGAAVRVELGVDVAQVRPDRVRRDEQLGGDLGRAKVGGQVADDAELGLAELLAQRARRSRRISARRRRARRGSVCRSVACAVSGRSRSSSVPNGDERRTAGRFRPARQGRARAPATPRPPAGRRAAREQARRGPAPRRPPRRGRAPWRRLRPRGRPRRSPARARHRRGRPRQRPGASRRRRARRAPMSASAVRAPRPGPPCAPAPGSGVPAQPTANACSPASSACMRSSARNAVTASSSRPCASRRRPWAWSTISSVPGSPSGCRARSARSIHCSASSSRPSQRRAIAPRGERGHDDRILVPAVRVRDEHRLLAEPEPFRERAPGPRSGDAEMSEGADLKPRPTGSAGERQRLARGCPGRRRTARTTAPRPRGSAARPLEARG